VQIITQARFLLSSFPMLKASFEAICSACGNNSGVKRQRGDPHAHSAPRIKLEGRDDDVSNAIANPAPVAVHSSSWEMQQTSSGGRFWRHTVTGETSWHCPPGHKASYAAASKTREFVDDCFAQHSSSAAAAAAADWSTYESDTRDILTRVAAGCAQFNMGPGMLPDTGRSSPFPVSNGVSSLQFTQLDFGVSFEPFFSEKTTSLSAQQCEAFLQMPALREDNRCFFIHLGVALGLHPVALQAIFRAHSDAMLRRIELALSQKTHEDDQRFDEVKMLEGSLQSVLRKNDMIEAAILSTVWPQEFQVRKTITANFSVQLNFLPHPLPLPPFHPPSIPPPPPPPHPLLPLSPPSPPELQNVRILIFTVGRSGPQPNACYLFSPRASADDADSFDGTDVILKLQGMHFTLLRPLDEHSSHSPIDQILDLFPSIDQSQPLHLHDSDAGSIVREVGRVQSMADLHRAHSPAPAPAPAPALASAAAAAPAPVPPNPDNIEPYD
jgi:hypothetical protein